MSDWPPDLHLSTGHQQEEMPFQQMEFVIVQQLGMLAQRRGRTSWTKAGISFLARFEEQTARPGWM
jgi:hypothetical protein